VAVVAVVVHHDRIHAREVARTTIDWLLGAGHQVRMPHADAARVERPDLGVADAEVATGAQVALSLGGDGTMLRTVALVAESDVPVVGVNFGQLGYLTDVEPDGVRPALERVLAGDHRVEHRMLLAATVCRAGAEPHEVVALNEVVLEKTTSGHTVRIDVDLDGAHFTPYAADGLIVATPTGSTAYAFSARGPIVDPTHRALLLTPVSPHMLFDRTLVLDDDAVVGLTVGGHRPAALVVDGHSLYDLAPGDRVTCRAASHTARLAVFGPRDFHAILKAKFGLADR
jgi:NAD+ kinase